MKQWPETRGNHTEVAAIERVNNLPEAIREYVWTNDPCWTYVPEGWTDHVLELHAKLVELCPDYMITQIKQKFGDMRFYVRGVTDDEARKLITEYELRAGTLCMKCGCDCAPGTQRAREGKARINGPWCDEHWPTDD